MAYIALTYTCNVYTRSASVLLLLLMPLQPRQQAKHTLRRCSDCHGAARQAMTLFLARASRA